MLDIFACVARVRHLATPAVPPIPRDRALVLMPRTWPKRLWRRLSGWTQGRKHRGVDSTLHSGRPLQSGGSSPAPSTGRPKIPRGRVSNLCTLIQLKTQSLARSTVMDTDGPVRQ